MTQARMNMFPRRARRRSVWVHNRVNTESLAAGSITNVLIDLNRQVDNADGLTVVRTIIDLAFGSDTSGGRGRLSAGVTLINSDQNAVGTSALPDPDASVEEADWIWLVPELGFIWTTGSPERRHVSYDIRSKRRYAQGDLLTIILKNLDATNGLDINGYARSLLLLP